MKQLIKIFRYPFSIGLFLLACIAALGSLDTLVDFFKRVGSFSKYGNPIYFSIYFITLVVYMAVAAIFLFRLAQYIIWIKDEKLISKISKRISLQLAQLIAIGIPFYLINIFVSSFLIGNKVKLTIFLIGTFWGLATIGLAFFLYYISRAIDRAINIDQENKLTI